MKAVEAKAVYKSFKHHGGAKRVLTDVSLSVESGAIYGVLGPNGAGKTTLLSILSTILKPDSGDVRVLGHTLQQSDLIREKINMSSGNPNFPWSLNVYENLNFYAMLYGMDSVRRKKAVEEAISLLELEPHRETRFDELSTGTKQRLSIAKSLLNEPKILFLDEPTVGLDPDIALKIRELIKRIHSQNDITILLTTHYMKEAEMLCDRIAFLKKGRIIAEGTPAELKNGLKLGNMVLIKMEEPKSLALDVPGVLDYSYSGNDLRIVVEDIETTLNNIINILVAGGVEISDLRIKEPDLEDVFLEFAK